MSKLLEKFFEIFNQDNSEKITYKDFVNKVQEDCKNYNMTEEEKTQQMINQLEKDLMLIVESYQKKRRGENVEKTFEQLEECFQTNMAKIIESKKEVFEKVVDMHFMKDLCDKFFDYKFVVQDNDVIHEAKTLKELKDKKIKCSKYDLHIKIKEAKKEFNNYVLLKQWWKPKFTEGKSIDTYILSTDKGVNIYIDKYIFNKELKEAISGSMYLRPFKNMISNISEEVEYLKPRSILNDTLMPSWIKKINHGKVCIKECSSLKKTFEFENEESIYEAVRESENSDFWVIKKV